MPITALKHLAEKKISRVPILQVMRCCRWPGVLPLAWCAGRLAGWLTGRGADTVWPRRDVIGQITHPFPDYLDNNMPLHDDQQTGHYLLMGSGR